jgi:hypothetical protein
MRPPTPTPPSDPETVPGTKPVIYTEVEVMRYKAMAKDRLQAAIVSTVFMWGIAHLHPDDPCYDIFECDPYMDCDTHVESEYHASKIMPQYIPVCCHCAGTYKSLIAMHTHFMAQNGGPYSIILHICEECIANGCHILARGVMHNAKAKQAKIDAKKTREVARLEKEATVAAQANVVDAQAIASGKSGAPPQPKRSRKRKVPDNNHPGTRSIRAPTLARVAEEVGVPEEGELAGPGSRSS